MIFVAKLTSVIINVSVIIVCVNSIKIRFTAPRVAAESEVDFVVLGAFSPHHRVANPVRPSQIVNDTDRSATAYTVQLTAYVLNY